MTNVGTHVGTGPATVPGASGSGVEARHPLYLEFFEEWEQMRDTYRGERVVKEAGEKYLPATSGMVEDGYPNANTDGTRAYNAYRMRAHFPDVVNEAVDAALGVMHSKPPVITVPEAMEPMLEAATLRHENMETLLRRINEEQLVTGRVGLLLDLPETESTDPAILPYIATYSAEHIINWDEGRRDGIVVDNLNFVSLNESEFEREDTFSWDFEEKYRVLILGDPDVNEPEGSAATYKAGVFRRDENNAGSFDTQALVEPQLRGRKLNQIPFVFINSCDIVPEPDKAPLLGLSNLSLVIYRGEADYRQALFMQGQDTLVVVDSPDDKFRTGANAVIKLNSGGSAEFIGVDSSGLPEMRTALENDKANAAQKGGQLLDSVSRERESGEALTVRVAARTASLNQVAKTGAFGLQRALRMAAEWMGLNPLEVTVEPNLDFTQEGMQGKQLVDLMTAKTMGAPISLQSIHQTMQDKDVTELTFEEELEQLQKERDQGLEDLMTPASSTEEDGPEEDEQDPDETEEETDPDGQGQ